MRTLAIETASEACSVALFGDDETLLARHREVIGRGHAEALIPMIAALPDKGRANKIVVSLGPGSFTGVRIGLAAARALGVAWGAQVFGYPTLALIAAMVRTEHAPTPVTVCMNGGHGEWFIAEFAADGMPCSKLASLAPQAALAAHPGPRFIAGNRAEEWAALADSEAIRAISLLPDAAHLPSVPSQLFTRNLAPIYGRGPDATVLPRTSAR